MARGEVPIEFQNTSTRVDAARIGQTLTWAERSDKFDPPVAVDDKKRQYSLKHRRKHTTVYGQYFEGLINYPSIAGDRLILVEELIDSIRGENPFTIKAANMPGIMRDIEAFVPSAKIPVPRIGACDEFSLAIPFEDINPTPIQTVAATSLAFGVQAAGAGGAAGVRFAYYYFPISITARTLNIRLSGDTLKLTVNGHLVVEHSTGTTDYVEQIPTSMLVENGINIMRVEAWQWDNAWLAQNVRID